MNPQLSSLNNLDQQFFMPLIREGQPLEFNEKRDQLIQGKAVEQRQSEISALCRLNVIRNSTVLYQDQDEYRELEFGILDTRIVKKQRKELRNLVIANFDIIDSVNVEFWSIKKYTNEEGFYIILNNYDSVLHLQFQG